jgi:CheY-like chemotaxis protein
MSIPHRPVVLIVNDGDTNGMYDVALSLAGFSTIHASNCLDALWQAREAEADVLVADLALQGVLDGVSLVRYLRTDSRALRPRIVLLTDSSLSDANAALTGCAMVLRKPCSPDALATGVSRVFASGTAAPAARPVSQPRASAAEALPNSVVACHELIRQLHRENVHLRQAGTFFGQLAERLNRQLRQYQDTTGAA